MLYNGVILTQEIGDGTGRGLPFRRDDDEELLYALELLLRLRHRAEAGEPMSEQERRVALAVSANFAGQLGRWAAIHLGLLPSPDAYVELSASAKRDLISLLLLHNQPIPEPLRSELAQAMTALRAGVTTSLLKSNKVGRRRSAPNVSAAAELDILKWIRWEYGLGRKLADVEAEVAAAIGCTPTAFMKWRKALYKIFDEKFVREILVVSEQCGKLEARRNAGTQPYLNTDEEFLLWHASVFERDLAILVARRHGAIQKRRAP